MEELQLLLESTVPPSLKTKIKGKEAREIALLIKPLMEEINIKTGQENDLMLWLTLVKIILGAGDERVFNRNTFPIFNRFG